MRRTAGTAALLLPLAALAVGPWFGIFPVASGPSLAATPVVWDGRFSPFVIDGDPGSAQAGAGRTVCDCRTVDVNLTNEVDNARIKTGDARVENLNITYVSSTYGDREVDVDQEAEAISGDAIAGQLVGVDARGPGCVNVRVHATNKVSDSTLETGDATAINRSVILLDPGVHRGDLEIDVEQDAVARSGDAIAGQLLGVIGGNRVGRCGGKVDLTAVNDVSDTKLKTGEASFLNDVDIRTCAQVGCATEFAALTGDAEIEVCRGNRCREVERHELAAALAVSEERVDDVEETDALGESPELTSSKPACAPEPTPVPTATPTADDSASSPPESDAEPSGSAAPSPAPQAAPGPSCATPEPSPSPEPEDNLMASGPEN